MYYPVAIIWLCAHNADAAVFEVDRYKVFHQLPASITCSLGRFPRFPWAILDEQGRRYVPLPPQILLSFMSIYI